MSDKSLVEIMASSYALQPDEFTKTVKSTCFPNGQASDEQLFLFLSVAREHQLNPFTREIYAFIQGGKLQIIVGVDGWAKIINRHPMFDGMEFDEHQDKTVCRIYRKDRAHPTEASEWLNECKRPTDPWNRYPKRMLRHKAMIQAARYAFGFAGIIEPDEFDRMVESTTAEAARIMDEPPPITVDALPPDAVLTSSSRSDRPKRGRPPKAAVPAAEKPLPKQMCAYCGEEGHSFNDCPQQVSATEGEAPSREAGNGTITPSPPAPSVGGTLSDDEQADIIGMAKSLRPKSWATFLEHLLPNYGINDIKELPRKDLGEFIKLMERHA